MTPRLQRLSLKKKACKENKGRGGRKFDSCPTHPGLKVNKMVSFEEQAKKLDFRGLVIGSIITSLAFVVGLFWRDAIVDTINQFIPEGEGLVYKYITAIIATITVVILAYILLKSQQFKLEHIKAIRRIK